MDAKDLRRAFTSFFVERGHTNVPSASLIPNDPTLLFTVAGMVPFKPFFLGEEVPPYSRATSVQKCVRAGGKHNDLEEIGRTKRHLTFFEMLGNFSFGDYFKAEAIPWAWQLVTEGLGFDPERLWVTVHLEDDEAADIWRDAVGVPPERIQRLDKDNFWQAGDTGPCGPCSEIFLDKGPAYGHEGGPAHGSEERYLEFWNLVFMQYDQQPDGSRLVLPRPSIDTGAGLERVLVLLQDVDSVWDVDEFVALREVAQSLTGVTYGRDEQRDVSLRILVDHARATTFLVSDGVFPSNEGRGYVLRRILRRAVRHAYLLGVERPVMAGLVDAVVDVMGSSYPDLDRSHDFVRGVIGREEERFRQTLRTGSLLLDDVVADLRPGAALAGDVAFQLHDTYGFPLEVTQEITAERGIDVDTAGFEVAMAEQRRRAKAARKGVEAARHFEAYQELVEQFGPTEYLAREHTKTDSRVLAVVGGPEARLEVFLDRSPFYAEAGGQIGDSGTIATPTGRARVLDTTYALPGLVRHEVEVTDGELLAGQEARAVVDVERRDAIRRNHTGTHLLHWALRGVLGDHVRQQGSLVAPERLRFDFSHYEPVSAAQLAEIEDLVAGQVMANHPVRAYETTKAHADEVGALAFFGDKYGDVVRVVEAGPSVELCGGTHVRATGDIGAVKVVAEASIGSNIRRLEAITGFDTIARLRDLDRRWRAAADKLNVGVDEVLEGIDRRLGELRAAQAEVKALRSQLVAGRVDGLLAEATDGALVARIDGLPRDDYRQLALDLRNRPGIRAVVLGGAADGGAVALVAAVLKGGELNAGELISDAARQVKGGGGRGDELAVAGGKEVAGLDGALDLVREQLGLPPAGTA
ncbi:MAG: alanine--tRNA ligase [Acidimicrobiia bacterium]|nr:alanine--tRNA ligase [Acidimicrobiia bacterium]